MKNEQIFVIENSILKRYTGPAGDVVIPEGVTTIDTEAFKDCTGLTRVTIPEGVTRIDACAFEGCTGLTSVTIPASVTDMSWPFQGCTALTDILVDAGNPVLRMTDGMLLKDRHWEEDRYGICVLGALPGITGELIVPEGVTSISSQAFHDCAGPFCITLPATIGFSYTHTFMAGRLSKSAFQGCTGLTGVTLSEGILYIEPEAFKGCSGLTSVTIPEGVHRIEKELFMDCTSLTRIDLPASVTEIKCTAFSGCTHLTHICVDAKNQVFRSFDGMLLTFDAGKPVLHYYPMGKAGAVGAVSIPEGITKIGLMAFSDFSALISIAIPASVTTICSNFNYCKNLTHICVADGNQTYLSMGGMLVKRDEVGLVLVRCPEGKTGELTIPQNITKIGPGAFSGCTRLTHVSIPQGITEIGPKAFYACARMERIDIPEGITAIGYTNSLGDDFAGISGETFKRCYHLKDVFLPASVTDIDKGAFSDCGNGKYVTHILTIHAPAGSYAEKYAEDCGYWFMSTSQESRTTRPERPRSRIFELLDNLDGDVFG